MNNFALLSALLDGPQTGVVLADRLGISRAAVWKRIEHLRLQGLAIDALENQGYALAQPTPLLDAQSILHAMHSNHLQNIVGLHLQFETESTQRLAIQKPAPEQGIEVWLAETQSHGQGRRGKLWRSPPLCNIYCSLNRRFACSIAAMSGFSLAVAVMLAESLRAMGVEGIALKWPNDIWLHGEKCAGLLIQIRGEVAGPCEVTVGFGINVAMPEQAGQGIDQAWTSLSKQDARAWDRNQIIASVLSAMLKGFEQYEQHGLAAFKDRWRGMDALHGKPVRLSNGAQIIDGIAQGIDEQGALQVQQGDTLNRYHSGELSVRVQHG